MRIPTLAFAGYMLVPAILGLRAAAAGHPLEPLSTNEIQTAVHLVLREGKVPTNAFFQIVALQEPPKESLLAWRPGTSLPRQAAVTAYDLPAHKTYEGIVDLSVGKVTSWNRIAGAEPLQVLEELKLSESLLKTNEVWLAALKRRGITDIASVASGGIPIGPVPVAGKHPDSRMLIVSPFITRTNRMTWEPIEGLTAIVDMSRREIVDIVDRGAAPISRGTMDFFDPAVRGPQDPPLKPLQVSQPEGSSFIVQDHAVTWDRWRLRYSVHPREGLILHQIGWEETPGKVRPVLFRASIADLLVPYADTDQAWSWRAYFDEADFGLGYNLQPLRRGFTTPSYATLLSEPLCDGLGGSRIATNVVDIYERDAGILWSHTESDTGTVGPRAREMVIGTLNTIGNYDYRFQWSFRQDGSIELHVYLTGIMQLKGVHARTCAACAESADARKAADPGGEQTHGVLVCDHLVAPHHQHFFSVRLDFDVDGTANSVGEYNVVQDRLSRRNPHGNGFRVSQTVFSKERDAVRDVNPASHRMWAVFNPNVVSALGHPSGYLIEPGMTVTPYLLKASPVRKRAGYIDHHLFVTRHRNGERYAAGEYPGGHTPVENVLTWTQNNESVRNSDIVTWFTLGVTHVARPEDFPVMPAAHVNLRISPKGFFPRNPALRVPDATPER